jgi:DNA-binding FrmR family transcriptional regulator
MDVKKDMVLSPETQKEILTRMRRIEGQARGVQRMIAEDRDCLDILTQLASLRSAAYGVSIALTQQYAMYCVRDAAHRNGSAHQNGSVLQSGSSSEAEVSPQGPLDDAMRSLVEVLLRAPH